MAQLKPLNKNIDVLILAGGKGERLKSVISDKPKVLAEISGQTFIDLILKKLAEGIQVKEILKDYPRLTKGHIQEILKYAHSLVAREEVYPVNP